MPQYEISVPGQGTFQVNSPTDLSDAQVWQAVQGQLKTKQEPESGALVSGFKSYLPQLQETYGGLKTLLGVGAERVLGAGDISRGLIESGAASLKEAEQRMKPLTTPERSSFSAALDKGVGYVLTEWLPYQAGSGAANILEALGTMAAGSVIGSALPGAGTVAGAGTGLVARELVKKGVKEAAEKILKEQGEDAAKAFFEKEAIQAARKIGQTAALGAQAGFYGAGQTTSRAVDEAEKMGGTANDIELARVLPAAAVSTVAEFLGDKISLGALEGAKGAKPGKSAALDLAKNVLLNIGVTGTKEAPVEIIQSAAERFGAKLSIADAEALKEYIDSAAAAYGMAVGPGATGGVRQTLAERAKKEEAPQTPPSIEEPPPAPELDTVLQQLSPQEMQELERQRALTQRPRTTEELLSEIPLQTGKPTTLEDVARIRDEHETAVIEDLLSQDAAMTRANQVAADHKEQQRLGMQMESDQESLAGQIADIDNRVRESRIFANVQDLIDRNIPFASTAINDINQKFNVINEAPLTDSERARIENIMGLVNVFKNFVNLPVLEPKPVDQFAQNQAMESLIKERKERGQAEPLRTAPVAPSPRIQEAPISQGVGEGAAVRPTGGVEPSIAQDRQLVTPAIAAPKTSTPETQIIRRQPVPDGMEVHVFKTTDGYGTGMFDADAGQYVNGSIVRFTGEDTLPKAQARAEEIALKATPVEKTEAQKVEPQKREPSLTKETDAFGKAIGAVRPYPGALRGRVNLPAQQAAVAGDFQGVLSALEKSKNVIVSEIAKRAKALGTKIAISSGAVETYTGPSTLMRQLSIDGAKMHLEALNKIRELAPQVDALPDKADLGYDIRGTTINAIDGGEPAGRMGLEDIAKMGHSMFAPLATGPIKLRTKEDFKALQKAYEDLTAEYGENALQLTSTGSAEMTGVAGKYDADTDTILVPKYSAKREEVLSHEIVHAQTVQAIANPTLRQKPVVARLNKLYEHVKKELEAKPGRAPYGIQSIQEFVAEGMGNPAFQFQLKKIKYENTSAWDSFVQMIANLIGVKKDTAFTELLSIYSELTAEQKEAAAAKPPAPKPVRTPVARSAPKTVMGSRMLADISSRLGGLDLSLLSEFSTKFIAKRKDKNGRPMTAWRNPMIPGVGTLFRRGGESDYGLIAYMLEEQGYLEPGSVERNSQEAGERAKELIKAALNREEVLTIDEQIEQDRARQEDFDKQAQEELEAERNDAAEEVGLSPDDMESLTDQDIGLFPTGLDIDEDVIAALSEIGYDDSEIRDEIDGREQERSGTEEAAAGRPKEEGQAYPPGEGFEGLTSYTAEDLRRRQEEQDQAASAERKAKAAEEERARKERQAKENKARADETLKDFELGKSAEEQMSGMGDMFNQPAEPAPAEGPGTGLIRSYWNATGYPAISKFLNAFSKIGAKRLEDRNIKPAGMSARDWLFSFVKMESSWDRGRKIGSTGIQYLSKKDLWPSNDGAGEELRKATLEAVRAIKNSPGYTSEILDQAFAAETKAKENIFERKSLGGKKLGFYSELENKVEQIGPKQAPAAMWKTMINALTQKGVKPDEIEWSGVNDWLDLQQGKVTKDQVLEYLKQGGVQVEETVLGKTKKYEDLADWHEAYKNWRDKNGFDDLTPSEIEFKYDLTREQEQEVQQFEQDFEDIYAVREGREIGGAKYGQYTLPGGENYREVLLTLPPARDSLPAGWSIKREDDALGNERWTVRNPDGAPHWSARTREQAIDGAWRNGVLMGKAAGDFRSSHWDQPNVLAHIRVNDRTDADGKRVLFVEEIQSDWGQQGKKRGFRKDADNSKATEADIDVREVRNPNTGYVGYEAFPRGNDAISLGRGEDRSQVVQEALSRLRSSSLGDTPGVPTAPFVTKTEGWLNLALKRIMVMAADGGYDRVAFITADQAHNRFPEKENGESTLPGFQAFYDTIVPTALKKLLPKVGGGKVGGVQVVGRYRNEGDRNFAVNAFREKMLEKYGDGIMIKMTPEERAQLRALERGTSLTQSGFDVTPAMRQLVEQKGLPLFSKKGVGAQKAEFEQTLRTLLNKFGLKDVGLSIIEGMDDAGSYAQQLIRIAAEAASPIRTLRHEAIHALRELGFFTDAQWNSLSKMAKDKWIDQYLKQRNVDGKPLKAGEESRYDAYMREYKGDMEKITEEAVADAFADFDATKPPAGLLQTLLKRLRDLFQSIKSALTKVESVDQIFGKVERGELKAGAREARGEAKSLRDRATENFKRWFGDSKVVDKNGEPLVVYHGTNADITKFDPAKQDPRDAGFWFANAPVYANQYAAGRDGGNVMPAYLSLQNPKIYYDRTTAITPELVEKLKDQGFDGIVRDFAGGAEAWRYAEGQREYAVFQPNQIKSAIGNNGEYSLTNADIRKSIGGVKGTPGQQALETIRAMGMDVPKPDPTKLEKAKAIWTKAKEDPKLTAQSAARTVRDFLDRVETWTFSSDAKLNNDYRRAVIKDFKQNEGVLGQLLEMSQSQAVHADALASQFLIDGGLKYNDKLKKWESFGSKANFPALSKRLDEIGKKYGLSKEQIERVAHAYLVAKRLPGILERNSQIDAEIAAENATAKPDKRKIKDLEDKKVFVSDKQLEQIEPGLSLAKTIPELKQVSDMWNEIRKNTIDVMVNSGLWSPEYAQAMWDNMDYVPYYRDDQIENEMGPQEFIKGLQVKSKEFQLKGSEDAVHDVFDNMIRWTQYAINRSVRAHKALQMIDNAKDIDVGDRKMAVKVDKEKRGMNIARVFRDGKQELYDMSDPLYVQAFAGIQNVSIPTLKFMSKVSDVLRNSVVLYPMFSVAQVPQDAFAAMFTSGLKPQHALKIPILAIKEFIKTLAKTSQTHNELKRFGATGVRDFSATVIRDDAEIYAGLKPPRGGWGKVKEALSHVSMAADNAVRQAVYEASIAQGVSRSEALEKAFEVINFRRKGTSRMLNIMGQTIPFFYAYLSAQRVAYKTLTGVGISPSERKEALTTLAMTSAAVATLSMLYAMANGDDEDYAETPAAIRDRTLTIPGSGGVRIPLRSDFFLFPKIIAEHTYLLLADKGFEDSAKFKKSMADGLVNAVASPTPFPTAVKPAIEVAINYDLFQGKPLIGQFEKQKDVERQFRDSTSELAKLIGQSGLISPIAVDHLIRGMFGSFGGLVLFGTNQFLHSDPNVPRPELSATEMLAALPGTSGVLKRPQESALKNDFYTLRDEVEKAVNTFNDIKTRSPEGAEAFLEDEKNMARLMLGKPVDKINQELSKIRRVMTQITNMPEDQMSAAEKAEMIREYRQVERDLLSSVDVKALREMAKI